MAVLNTFMVTIKNNKIFSTGGWVGSDVDGDTWDIFLKIDVQ